MNTNEIESEIKSYLVSKMGVADSTNVHDRLFSSGMLDSVSALDFISFLESKFQISISAIDVSIDDLDSIGKVRNIVLEKLE